MRYQRRTEELFRKNNLEGTVEFRIMDLVSEVGELAKDATKSSEYGMKKEELEVSKDELGDVLFSLCAVANELDIDLEEAFEKAIRKYESRIEDKGDPGSR